MASQESMLSLLVLFTIDFPCKCFTIESSTIIVQGRSYVGR